MVAPAPWSWSTSSEVRPPSGPTSTPTRSAADRVFVASPTEMPAGLLPRNEKGVVLGDSIETSASVTGASTSGTNDRWDCAAAAWATRRHRKARAPAFSASRRTIDRSQWTGTIRATPISTALLDSQVHLVTLGQTSEERHVAAREPTESCRAQSHESRARSRDSTSQLQAVRPGSTTTIASPTRSRAVRTAWWMSAWRQGQFDLFAHLRSRTQQPVDEEPVEGHSLLPPSP